MTKRRHTEQDSGGEPPKKPARTGRPLGIWIPSALRDAIDDYISAQDVPPDLTAVVRRSIEDFLRAKGFWPRRPRP